jgi:hypothetical protein
MIRDNILVSGHRPQPSAKGALVRFSDAKRSIIDEPFADTAGLIAGFWIGKVKPHDKAIAWVKHCPNPMPGKTKVEIRHLFETEDFGAEPTPELRAQEERLRAESAVIESATN